MCIVNLSLIGQKFRMDIDLEFFVSENSQEHTISSFIFYHVGVKNVDNFITCKYFLNDYFVMKKILIYFGQEQILSSSTFTMLVEESSKVNFR